MQVQDPYISRSAYCSHLQILTYISLLSYLRFCTKLFHGLIRYIDFATLILRLHKMKRNLEMSPLCPYNIPRIL